MAESNHFQPIITSNLLATILDGETQSAAVDLSGTTLSALAIPAEFEGASLTLQSAATSAGTYYPVYDVNGVAHTITCAASRVVTLEPSKMAGLRFIKLTANTAQTGDVSITLLTRPV